MFLLRRNMDKSGKKELRLEQNTKETEEKKKTEEILSFLSWCDIVMWCWHFFFFLSYFFLSFGGKLIVEGVNIAGVGGKPKLRQNHLTSYPQEVLTKVTKSSGGSLAEWLGCWTCNLVVLSSSPPPCHSLELFLVAPSSTPWLCSVNSQLVCLLPVGIFEHLMFVCIFSHCI